MVGRASLAVSPSEAARRWIAATVVLLSLSVFINYIDRGNLSTASPLIKDELHLSATQLGFLLTAFFITYAPLQPLVGWLVDRFEPGKVLLTGYVVWSVATILTGFAQSFTALLAMRLLLGVGESVAFPSYARILVRCFPEEGRGTASAAIMAAMALGPAFGVFFGGVLIAEFGWRTFFIAFGVITLAWIFPWLVIPTKGDVRAQLESPKSVSLLAILRERALWGASLGQFAANFVWYFVLTWIPYYLVHERHWSLREMATIGGIAYLTMAVSVMASGVVEDRWIRAGTSPTIVRKAFTVVGALGSALFMLGCVFSNVQGSVAFLMLTCASMGMVSPNILAIPQTLAGPAAAGRWMGVQNAIGNCAGIIAPALAGILVDRTGSFIAPFAIAAAMSVLGAAAFFFIIGPIEPIDWASRPLRSVAKLRAV